MAAPLHRMADFVADPADEAATFDAVRLVFKGDADGLQALLDKTPNAAKGHDETFNDATALHVAVGETQPGCARALLNAGADANARDVEKRTPLHQVDAACPRVMVDILVAGGGDVKATDVRGWTPLHAAAAAMAVNACAALLTNGADAAATAKDGLTALDIATSGDPDDADDLNFADLGLEDADGDDQGPLPRRNHFLVELLVKAGGGTPPGECKWLVPDLDRHDFDLRPRDPAAVAGYAVGEIVELTVTAAVDDFSSDEDSDGEDKDTVEAPARFMLVERRDDLWRGYLVGAVLPEKFDTGLMLLPGRELVVSVAARPP